MSAHARKLTMITNHLREQIERDHPGAVSFKRWYVSEAGLKRLTESAIQKRYYRGLYPNLKTKRLNPRVVLVLNP